VLLANAAANVVFAPLPRVDRISGAEDYFHSRHYGEGKTSP